MPRSQHPGREGVGHARQPAHLPRAYLSRAPPLTSRPRPPPAGSSIRRRRRSRPSAATQTYFSRRPFRAPLEQPGLQLRGRRVPHTRILLYFFFPRIRGFASADSQCRRSPTRGFAAADSARRARLTVSGCACNAVVSVSKKINKKQI